MMGIDPLFFYLGLGVALIAVEVLILGLAVFWFLLIGVGALVAAIYAGVVSDATWLTTTSVFVIASVAFSALLYKPLKRWQKQPSAMPGNDAIGQVVEVVAWESGASTGKVTWSGAQWDARLAAGSEPLNPGDSATIKELSGISLVVSKKSG